MTTPVEKSNETPVSFRLEPELKSALERIAERNDRSLSAEIRRALKKHVTAEAATA